MKEKERKEKKKNKAKTMDALSGRKHWHAYMSMRERVSAKTSARIGALYFPLSFSQS